MPLADRILFEDHHLIIVNKLAGEIVQGDKTGDVPLVEECGAGAVSGDAAGMVVVASETSPADLCARYGYELMTVRPDPLGARIV